MPEKFRNTYRIASARLQNWDYGWNASYFITICTQNRACVFGEIEDGTMHLSEIGMSRTSLLFAFTPGEIANGIWLQIPDHFTFVQSGNHVVMPNHVHGIVIIDKTDDPQDTDNRRDTWYPDRTRRHKISIIQS